MHKAVTVPATTAVLLAGQLTGQIDKPGAGRIQAGTPQ